MCVPAEAPAAMVVLAAGGSRRLGRPKQLLQCDGISLIRRLALIGRQLPLGRLLVVTGAHRDAVEAELDGLALEIVRNPAWADGMAGSVRAAVQALGSHPGRCLFTTVDQPALDLAHLQAMMETARHHPGKDIASHYDGLAGVPVLLRSGSWRQALQLEGDTGLRRLLRARPREVHCLENPRLALDVDTPASLQQAIRHGWLDPLTES